MVSIGSCVSIKLPACSVWSSSVSSSQSVVFLGLLCSQQQTYTLQWQFYFWNLEKRRQICSGKNQLLSHIAAPSSFLFFFFCSIFFLTTIVPHGFLLCEIQVAFSGESQLQQSRATQPTVHAGCFSVSIIHQTLTWTTGSLTWTQMLMHVIAHGGVQTHVRESALKVDTGRDIPWHTS